MLRIAARRVRRSDAALMRCMQLRALSRWAPPFPGSPRPAAPTPALPPVSRSHELERMQQTAFDVVVVGGGCVGAGVAWEAATRGLKVALVERGDFGSGTSGRSTKLIHGGVRYLESAVLKLDIEMFHMVQEALRCAVARRELG